MRLFDVMVAAIATIAAVSGASAQTPAPDGKARLASPAGPYFTPEGITRPAAKADMRAAIVTLMADGKLDTMERDFLNEVVAQTPFALAIDGGSRELSVPAASPDAVAQARLLMSIPNMHTLWHADPEKTEQLLEISRWGPAAKSRVEAFVGNKLYEAWGQSTPQNEFTPFANALGQEWNAVKKLSDPVSVREGKLLLIAGCDFAKEKYVSEGKAPPADLLCNWMRGSL
jgi:hypothetical protein